MASSCSNRGLLLLLASAVLLSGLAAGRRWEWESQCQPWEAFPHNPLSGCRGYVISRACRATGRAARRWPRRGAASSPPSSRAAGARRCGCSWTAWASCAGARGRRRGPPPPRSWRRGSATCGVAPARRSGATGHGSSATAMCQCTEKKWSLWYYIIFKKKMWRLWYVSFRIKCCIGGLIWYIQIVSFKCIANWINIKRIIELILNE